MLGCVGDSSSPPLGLFGVTSSLQLLPGPCLSYFWRAHACSQDPADPRTLPHWHLEWTRSQVQSLPKRLGPEVFQIQTHPLI